MSRHLQKILFLFVGLIFLSACNEPIAIPSVSWCSTQPCLEFFGITISQPSSSILVYVLAVYGLYVGFNYFKNRAANKSKLYWSISLVLGGLGALAAGTSFQAFGYEIKCAGKEFCDATSIYEIVYNILTVWSASFLFLAVRTSLLRKASLKMLDISLFLFGIAFTVLTIIAFRQHIYFLVSFEFLLLCISPVYLGTFIITGLRFAKSKDEEVKKYLYAWLILITTLLTYYLYLSMGLTELLWEKGIWFSANDVLHLGMMGWLFYLSNGLMGVVEDNKSLK